MQCKLPENAVALFRSFVAIAENPNFNQTAHALKISRHTLKYRIKALEELCGYQLLEPENANRYKLTLKGEIWAQELRVWLQQGEAIFSDPEERSSGFVQSIPSRLATPYYNQQQPLSALWEHDTPYLKSMLLSWVKAEGQYGHPALKRVCDNAVLARPRDSEFIIMGIGKNAALVKWLGKEWCLSAVGRPLSSTAISTKADQIVTHSYRKAMQNGSPWYDHVSMELPRPVKGIVQRANYRRLILPCKLPDGSPMVASIVEISDEVAVGQDEVLRSNQATRES